MFSEHELAAAFNAANHGLKQCTKQRRRRMLRTLLFDAPDAGDRLRNQMQRDMEDADEDARAYFKRALAPLIKSEAEAAMLEERFIKLVREPCVVVARGPNGEGQLADHVLASHAQPRADSEKRNTRDTAPQNSRLKLVQSQLPSTRPPGATYNAPQPHSVGYEHLGRADVCKLAHGTCKGRAASRIPETRVCPCGNQQLHHGRVADNSGFVKRRPVGVGSAAVGIGSAAQENTGRGQIAILNGEEKKQGIAFGWDPRSALHFLQSL